MHDRKTLSALYSIKKIIISLESYSFICSIFLFIMEEITREVNIVVSKCNITWYLEKMIELLCFSPKEDQFQSYLIYPIIEEVINKKKESINIELIDCHNFAQDNTKTHTRYKYSVLSKAIPDLLIARNFFYNNRDEKIYNSMQSIASVEVKVPNSVEMLNKYVNSKGDKSKKEYNDQLYIQILASLVKNNKVILTNARKWEFFDNSLINDEKLALNVEIKTLNEDIKRYVEIIEICGFDSYTDYKNPKTKELKKDVIESKKKLLIEVISKISNNTTEEESKFQVELKELLKKARDITTKDDFNKIINDADKQYIQKIKKYIKLSHIKTIDIIKKGEPEKKMEVYGSSFDQMMEADDTEYVSGIQDIKYNLESFDDLKLELEKFLYENEKNDIVNNF